MVEIVFGSSAAGGLRIAQRFGVGNYSPGWTATVPVFRVDQGGKRLNPLQKARLRRAYRQETQRRNARQEARRRELWEKVPPLGTSAGDIFAFHAPLCTGDISGEGVPEGQLWTMEEEYAACDFEDEAQRTLMEDREQLEALRQRMGQGEKARIWTSENPYELCGTLWMLSCIRGWDLDEAQVQMVKLPRWEQVGSTLRAYKGWGELSDEDFCRLAQRAKRLTPLVISAAANRWAQLQEENAPLRVSIDGRLQSVPEDFYDFVIRQELARQEETFPEPKLIGEVLGRRQIPISSGWIALRIQAMVDAGELEVCETEEEGTGYYRRTLRKKS